MPLCDSSSVTCCVPTFTFYSGCLGIMRVVGKALSSSQDAVCIGISPWSKLAKTTKEALVAANGDYVEHHPQKVSLD